MELDELGLTLSDVDLGRFDAESDYKLAEHFVRTPYVESALAGQRTLFPWSQRLREVSSVSSDARSRRRRGIGRPGVEVDSGCLRLGGSEGIPGVRPPSRARAYECMEAHAGHRSGWSAHLFGPSVESRG